MKSMGDVLAASGTKTQGTTNGDLPALKSRGHWELAQLLIDAHAG